VQSSPRALQQVPLLATPRVPAHATGRAPEPVRSTRRCRRRPARPAASGFVIDSIVFDRRALRLSIPDGNGAGDLRLQHDHADGVADELRDAAPGSGSGLAQGIEFLLAEIHLGFDHICQFRSVVDTRQFALATMTGSLDWQAREDGLHPNCRCHAVVTKRPLGGRSRMTTKGSVHKRLKTNEAPLAQLDRATAF
jgi:hypothetical protein